MEKQDIFNKLPKVLLPWYEQNKRDLPWRKDNDPYHIWLSEIMLQQTRVEAVKGYYGRFSEMLPTVESLSKAQDEQLHKLWEGLGYYSRVRNLKKAAVQIMQLYDGQFPEDYDTILKLPGIGPYTAGAICSIAFNQPTPAVDGNVLRVVSRLTGDNTPIDQAKYRKQVESKLAAIYPSEAGAFTQAVMELGATICGPNKKPDCHRCPCKEFCVGFRTGIAEKLPLKSVKKPRCTEEMTVFIISCDNTFALEKRPNTGLLASMWQFPNVPDKLEMTDALGVVESYGLNVRDIYKQVERKHIFTHVEWDMNGIYVEVTHKNDRFCWLSADQIRQETALPTAFRQFWQ